MTIGLEALEEVSSCQDLVAFPRGLDLAALDLTRDRDVGREVSGVAKCRSPQTPRYARRT